MYPWQGRWTLCRLRHTLRQSPVGTGTPALAIAIPFQQFELIPMERHHLAAFLQDVGCHARQIRATEDDSMTRLGHLPQLGSSTHGPTSQVQIPRRLGCQGRHRGCQQHPLPPPRTQNHAHQERSQDPTRHIHTTRTDHIAKESLARGTQTPRLDPVRQQQDSQVDRHGTDAPDDEFPSFRARELTSRPHQPDRAGGDGRQAQARCICSGG